MSRPEEDCAACEMEYRGWGGKGCCDTCDTQTYNHTCIKPAKDKEETK